MNAHERTLSLIHEIYTAAADEAHWPAVLEGLADEYRGAVSGFQYRTGLAGHVTTATFVRVDPTLQDAICTYYATRNPWVRGTQPLFRTRDVIVTDQILSLSALRRTEYYDGILQPLNICHGFGACVFRRGDDVLTFTVVRDFSKGPYQPVELTRVRAMLPHLRRAIQVNQRLSQLDRTRAALADGVEHLQHGVVIVNHHGHAIFANRAARAIVAQHDGVSLTPDGLVASAYGDRLRLRSLLDDAVRTTAGNGFGSGGAMRVARPSQKRPFLVVVAPMALTLEGDRPSGLATVFISDPDAHSETNADVLQRTYGFTAAEADVACAFAATGGVDLAAKALHISRETARWHLRHIYRKTGAHRQTALLKCLLDGPSRLRPDMGSTHKDSRPQPSTHDRG